MLLLEQALHSLAFLIQNLGLFFLINILLDADFSAS